MSILRKNLYYIAWTQALLATLGSLFFSQVLGIPPCILCWYQRICMYPLLFILTVGILKKDKNLPLYVLPLSILGLLIALYHNLLYIGLIPESTAPCTIGVSCTSSQVDITGFITIPLLSLFSFTLITFCMVSADKYNKNR